jgi:hemerythrin-like domain-containing protein
MVDFFTRFADGFHHAKEEALLFPALAEQGIPVEDGPVGCMTSEHERGRALLGEVEQSAQALDIGNERSRRKFVEAARAYILLLADHIRKEDEVLFTIAETALDPVSKERLAEAFRSAEIALGDPRQKYERLALKLETEVSGTLNELVASSQ